MREIKFRAWDGKKMLENVGVMNGNACIWKQAPKSSAEFTVVVNGETFYGYSDWDAIVERPEFILMQFTGLRDKNGKEIYEGDIVACIKNKFGKNRHEFWVVEYGYFGDAAFYVSNQLNSGRLLERGEERYDCATFSPDGTQEVVCEIIGNIYENPELLEAK